jgi:hypothetical protein
MPRDVDARVEADGGAVRGRSGGDGGADERDERDESEPPKAALVSRVLSGEVWEIFLLRGVGMGSGREGEGGGLGFVDEVGGRRGEGRDWNWGWELRVGLGEATALEAGGVRGGGREQALPMLVEDPFVVSEGSSIAICSVSITRLLDAAVVTFPSLSCENGWLYISSSPAPLPSTDISLAPTTNPA